MATISGDIVIRVITTGSTTTMTTTRRTTTTVTDMICVYVCMYVYCSVVQCGTLTLLARRRQSVAGLTEALEAAVYVYTLSVLTEVFRSTLVLICIITIIVIIIIISSSSSSSSSMISIIHST